MREKKLNLNLPRPNGVFITATDTGVGKTLIAGGIAKILADDGIKVGCFKPIATGCRQTNNGLVSTDAEFLAKYSNVDLPLETINPIRYEIPAAPLVSAEAENKDIDFSDLVKPYKTICDNSNFVIVEGIGGVRVPLTTEIDVLDMANEFALPIILVTRPNLGTLNHTLLSIDAIRNAGLELAGVIISGYDPHTKETAEKTVQEIIIRCGDIDVMATVPLVKEADTEKLELGKSYYTLEDIPFLGIGAV